MINKEELQQEENSKNNIIIYQMKYEWMMNV